MSAQTVVFERETVDSTWFIRGNPEFGYRIHRDPKTIVGGQMFTDDPTSRGVFKDVNAAKTKLLELAHDG